MERYQCLVTFNLSRSVSSLRDWISRGHGLSRLSPGPPAPSSSPLSGRGSASSTSPRPSSPVRAYHQYRRHQDGQRRDRRGLHRRPALAGPRRRRLPEETGDTTILDERVPFSDVGDATLDGHLERSVQYTLDRIGPTDCRSSDAPTGRPPEPHRLPRPPGESFQTTETSRS